MINAVVDRDCVTRGGAATPPNKDFVKTKKH